MPAKGLPFIKCNDAEFQVPYFLIGFYNYTRIIVGRNDLSGPDLIAKNWFCSSCWQMLCQLRMTDLGDTGSAFTSNVLFDIWYAVITW